MPAPRRTLDLQRAAHAVVDDAGRPRSTAEVARRLGMAKPTLFKLAGSRDALEAMCIEAEVERLLGRLAALPERVGGRGAAVWVDALASELSELALPLLMTTPAQRSLRRVEDRLAQMLQAAGAIPAGMSHQEAGSALLGAAAAVARRRGSSTERLE